MIVPWAQDEEMNHGVGRLAGVGGRQLFRQSWLADDGSSPRAVVVIVHGAGEHSGRYEHVAARLVAEGYAVHALDHRGHGRSEGPRALIDRIDNAAADLDQLVVTAGAEHPGLPCSILGHRHGRHDLAAVHARPSGSRSGHDPVGCPGIDRGARRRCARSVTRCRWSRPRLPLIAIDSRPDQPRPGGRRRLQRRPARAPRQAAGAHRRRDRRRGRRVPGRRAADHRARR